MQHSMSNSASVNPCNEYLKYHDQILGGDLPGSVLPIASQQKHHPVARSVLGGNGPGGIPRIRCNHNIDTKKVQDEKPRSPLNAVSFCELVYVKRSWKNLILIVSIMDSIICTFKQSENELLLE